MVTSPYEWKILERDEKPQTEHPTFRLRGKRSNPLCHRLDVINMVKNNNINNHTNIHRVILGVKTLKEGEGKPK